MTLEKVWINTILSTLLISAVSFSGILFLALRKKLLNKTVFILVSFAVGALFGNSFFILVPESFHEMDAGPTIGLLIVAGLLFLFVVEKFIHWYHNHDMRHIKKVKAIGPISLLTDTVHNFTDGILVAAAWMFSPETGISTTIAVLLHEIPQEIGDFGLLIHAGFSRKKALLLNFVAACSAILGAALTLLVGQHLSNISIYILPVAAGGFIYLAGSDLIPELQRERSVKKSLLQFISILAGLALMYYVQTTHEHSHNVEHEHTTSPHMHHIE